MGNSIKIQIELLSPLSFPAPEKIQREMTTYFFSASKKVSRVFWDQKKNPDGKMQNQLKDPC